MVPRASRHMQSYNLVLGARNPKGSIPNGLEVI